MFKTILICLDGSNLAEQVIHYTVDVASRYSSRVVPLQAVPPSVSITPGVSVRTSLSLEQSALEYLEGMASSIRTACPPTAAAGWARPCSAAWPSTW